MMDGHNGRAEAWWDSFSFFDGSLVKLLDIAADQRPTGPSGGICVYASRFLRQQTAPKLKAIPPTKGLLFLSLIRMQNAARYLCTVHTGQRTCGSEPHKKMCRNQRA